MPLPTILTRSHNGPAQRPLAGRQSRPVNAYPRSRRMCVRSAAHPRHCLVLAGLLWGGIASAADAPVPEASQEAQSFLLRYTGLTSTADVAALDMYRDDARVRVATMVDGRETQVGIVDGKKWKDQLPAGWFDGTTKLEASTFDGATVKRDDGRLLIRAQRYSQTRCYWDS